MPLLGKNIIYKGSKRAELTLAHVIQHLKAHRLEQHLSHETLSKMAGISRAALSHIENGKRKPSLLVSLRLAKALGIELSEILKQAESDTQRDKK